jgi:hypothetical protein
MIQFDNTVSLGSIGQIIATLLLLFYVGRWVGKTDQRFQSVEADVSEIKTGYITKAEAHALHSAQSLEHASIRREIQAMGGREG